VAGSFGGGLGAGSVRSCRAPLSGRSRPLTSLPLVCCSPSVMPGTGSAVRCCRRAMRIQPPPPPRWPRRSGRPGRPARSRTLRDLYAVAAAGWVASGLTAHYALVPATDEDLVRAWFRLGFGQQACHGLRGLPAQAPVRRPGLTIRRAVREDIPALAELDVELLRHQSLAPVFSAAPVPPAAEAAGEWAEDFDDPGYTTFVAERDGIVVGSAVGCALEKSGSHTGLARPDNAGFLGFAAVFPSARGHGAGRALGETVLQWAAQGGFGCVVIDWRVTNLLSSRTWPALGFAESFLRLHRLIGY